MTNVIGPVDPSDWVTMIMLRGSVQYMKDKNNSKFQGAIEKEHSLYKEILEPYLTRAANDNSPAKEMVA